MYQSFEEKIEKLKQQHKIDDVVELLKKMLVKEPTNEFALLQMADIYFAQGNLDAARKPITFLLSREPHNPMALYVQGVIAMEQENWHDAKESFTLALQKHNSDNPEILRCYALTEQALGNRERAIQFLEKAYTIHSYDAEIIINLITLYLAQESFTRVRELVNHYETCKDRLETYGKEMATYDHHIALAKKCLLAHLTS